MTLAEFTNLVRFDVKESDVQNVNKTIGDIKSLATRALGAIGVSLSIAGIKKGIEDCVNLASEVQEMQNKFDVVFKGMNDTVEDWASNFADKIGRNANDIKTYLADIQNLVVGFMGTDMREEAYELTRSMTELALDLASFNNTDEKVAVNAMQKAVMGESEAAKTIGAVLNDVTRAEAMATLGLKGKYDALDQATKMMVNYQAILNQSPDAIGDCERSLGSYRSTMIAFESKAKEIKTLIGQFFMPVMQKGLATGTKILVQIRDFVSKIQTFADRVGGAEKVLGMFVGTLGLFLALLNADKIRKFIDGISKINLKALLAKAKILGIVAALLLLFLIIEDFVSFLQGKDSIFGTLLEKAGVDVDAVRTKILDAWGKIKSFLSDTWNTIKNTCSRVWGRIKDFFTEHKDQIIGTLTGAWETIKTVLSTIWGIISTVAKDVWGVLKDFWSENGEQVKTDLLTIWNSIKDRLSQIWNIIKEAASLAWESIKTIAVTVFNNLKNFWQTWGDTIITIFSGVWEVIKSVFGVGLDLIANLLSVFAALISGDWKQVGENLKTLAQDLVNGLVEVISTLGEQIANVLSSIWDAIGEKVTTTFNNIVEAVKTKISNIKTAIVDGFNAAIDWIKALPQQALTWGADIIDAIVEGITGAVGRVGEAVSGVAQTIRNFLGFSEPDEGPLSNFHTYMPDMIDLMSKGILEGRNKVRSALGTLAGDMSVMAQANIVSPRTRDAVSNNSNISRNVVQNVNINNQYNGDRAIQKQAAAGASKTAKDATAEMARALAYTR